ncbi:MAG: hypothetical protein KBH33_01240 [Alicycliphilus sp.]|jgi:hypothetical protein|uniref:DUF2188 domain-containing protein n=1 Tax=Diaphorobacter limosus TaxID=3036128 RepID=A0ABZ0J565_9BURK|nr:hypothetical protein [Diaphorobacter sp. Y-1]MBP7327997.1 hypothetical protein [Alicycliphilus sp.]MCA0438888.1 hypothetical protein [Pseudomonadota bacterium]MBP8778317.1 hypothetical protein [Alicycliphilus sp.]TXJ06258.1 MAG: hypothetical protein E6Q29_11665 [Alicycliphilus sp.]WOO32242.1 hypothetical protein P4826_17930 [Diaphorobacter sp. Y-1]
MNGKPLENARSSDLRGSWQALQRAAQRAREVAVQTGTDLVVTRNGVLEHIKPQPTPTPTPTPELDSPETKAESA